MKQKQKKIVIFGGTRPNFIKIAPLLRELKKQKKYFKSVLINTNQHSDFNMNQCFFKDLNIAKPKFQIQNEKKQIEKVLKIENPDIACVVGDVNSTLEAAIAAKRLNIKLAHIEAGLRSFDRSMPEEINRIATDAISDLFFITEESAKKNLLNEGHSKKNISFVGNLMIDNLFYEIKKMKSLKNKKHITPFGILTLHRPSNVDSKKNFQKLAKIIRKVSLMIPLFFPVHPRTKKSIKRFGIKFNHNVTVLKPQRFPKFLKLLIDAKLVLTDSGGLQEEATGLRIPCITLRKNTERPITSLLGTNKVLDHNEKNILKEVSFILNKKNYSSKLPKMWDGKTAQRIVKILKKIK